MPNFKPNPDGMKPSGFKMKNSALNMNMRTGSPMQSNYKESPVKVWPIVAKIVAVAAKAGKAAAMAAKAAKATKAGAAVVKGVKTVKGVYNTSKVAKTAVDTVVSNKISDIMAPKEEEEVASITGEQKSIM